MKTTPKAVRLSESGFTLVELMIVVAIIGILAAIAIPNFQKYQAKARQKESTIQLAAAYTAEASQFGEQSSYSGCLSNIGFAPDLAQGRYYLIGFNAVPTTGCGTATGTCLATQWDTADAALGGVCTAAANATFYAPNKKVSSAYTLPTAAGSLPAAATVTKNAFNIGSVGNVINANTADVWYVDQAKNIVNSTAGI